MIKNKKIVSLAVLTGLFLSGTIIFAQTDSQIFTSVARLSPMSVSIEISGESKLSGIISEVNHPDSSALVTVRSWGGVWKIDISSAELLNKSGKRINRSDIKPGHEVEIFGTASTEGFIIKAQTLKDNSVPAYEPLFKTYSGVVKKLGNSGNFDLLDTENKVIRVITTSNTRFHLPDPASSINDLKDGMAVGVSGIINKSGVLVAVTVWGGGVNSILLSK